MLLCSFLCKFANQSVEPRCLIWLTTLSEEQMGKMTNLEKGIDELTHNNQTALEELFNYYFPRLYNFSRSFLKLEDGIDDVL